MTRRSLLLLIAGAAALGGCASRRDTSNFMKSVNSIRPGTARGVVRDELGEPDEKRDGIVRVPMPPGPTENLLAVAPAGTQYQHWIYKHGDSHFHVFFTPSVRRPGGWDVAQVRSTPKTMVY